MSYRQSQQLHLSVGRTKNYGGKNADDSPHGTDVSPAPPLLSDRILSTTVQMVTVNTQTRDGLKRNPWLESKWQDEHGKGCA